jgi:hypothetical protein
LGTSTGLESKSLDLETLLKAAAASHVPKSEDWDSSYVPKSEDWDSSHVPKSEDWDSSYVPKSEDWDSSYVPTFPNLKIPNK